MAVGDRQGNKEREREDCQDNSKRGEWERLIGRSGVVIRRIDVNFRATWERKSVRLHMCVVCERESVVPTRSQANYMMFFFFFFFQFV